MFCKVEKKAIEEIVPTSILPQTSFWARVKINQGFIANGFQLTVSRDLLNPGTSGIRKINDDLLVLIKYLNQNQCYAYVPYGPKIRPDFENYGLFLEELSEVLKPCLPSNCIYIKYDLPWENQWAAEEDFFDNYGDWVGPPSDHTQEFRLNYNTQNWNLQKSASDVLPANTFFLDLRKHEHEIFNRMKPKTRYNIRHALRRGVQVREYGAKRLNDWYKLYTETALRNHLTLHHKDYFSSVLKQQGSTRNVKVSLLMADYQGMYLSAMFLVLSGKRATYLYGASSSERRNLMASYALQWEAIKKAKRYGCTEYDMFGCAPNSNESHPLHGLYRYKRGFGGNLYHRMGCWDYPYHMHDYKLVKAGEVNNQSYHS